MATTAVARRYFEALSAHDLDAATAHWTDGATERFVGRKEVTAPDGVRAYFGALFDAFPDFRIEILETTTYRNRSAVRWRATGTFGSPGTTASGSYAEDSRCAR